MSLDFKPEDKDIKPFRRRLLVAFGLILAAFSVLVARFAWLQIINQNAYVERAERNRTVSITTQGSRGLIFDRNRTLVAGNVLAYSLEITPDKVKNVNATIDELAKVIPITPADRRRFRRLREDLNRYDSIPIRAELTDEEVATFIGQRWRFPGVEINQREYRIYPNGTTGSHFIGYIGSISASDQKRGRSPSTKAHATSARSGSNAVTRRSCTVVRATKAWRSRRAAMRCARSIWRRRFRVTTSN